MSHHDSMASQDSLKPLDAHKEFLCAVIKVWINAIDVPEESCVMCVLVDKR